MGLPSASGFYTEKQSIGPIGSSAPGLHFGPCEHCTIRYSFASPVAQRDPGKHPLLQFGSPSGCSPEGPAPTSQWAHLLWLFPRRLAHLFRRSPHNPKASTLWVKVRVQDFSPSSRFSPPPASQVYFTPLTPFDFSLQGFPLPRSSTNSSLAPCRHAVSPWLRTHRLERWDLRRTS